MISKIQDLLIKNNLGYIPVSSSVLKDNIYK